MKSFRVNLSLSEEVNYWGDPEASNSFRRVPDKYFSLVERILDFSKSLNYKGEKTIPYIWFFYEPHIEITWVSEHIESSVAILNKIREVCPEYGIEPPKDNEWLKDGKGGFVDWFCESEDEREFGAKRHDLCRQFVELYNEHKESIDKGKGLNKQVERTIHTLCNPLGLNYTEEAKICFSRGLICILFKFFSFSKAVWIYKNIFRQKY